MIFPSSVRPETVGAPNGTAAAAAAAIAALTHFLRSPATAAAAAGAAAAARSDYEPFSDTGFSRSTTGCGHGRDGRTRRRGRHRQT